MICARKARRATSSWQRSYSQMNKLPEAPRRALGKGLTALLPVAPPQEAPNRIRMEDIDPNPMQPRRVFEPERLQELANSIQVNGVIQPIVVRPNGGRYQLVAG